MRMGALAQLVEQVTLNHRAGGSIPSRPIALVVLFVCLLFSCKGSFLDFGDIIPPQILTSYPGNGDVNVSLHLPILIIFSEAMNMQETQNAIAISPSLSLQWQWSADRKMLTIGHSALFTPSTTYTLSISTGARDIAGNRLLLPFQIRFTTASEGQDTQPPQILYTEPQNNATNIPVRQTVRIVFNEPMNQSSTESAITIQPSVAPNFFWDDLGTVLSFTAQFQEGVTYTITVGTGAKDLSGNLLLSSFTFQFTTVPPSPVQPVDFSVKVVDICQNVLPGAYLVVEDQKGILQHQVKEGDSQISFFGLYPPYTATVAYRKSPDVLPHISTYVFTDKESLFYTVPVNQENCPPPPPPPPDGSKKAALRGVLTNFQGPRAEVYTTNGGFAFPIFPDNSFSLADVYPGNLVLYAYELDEQSRKKRMGMLSLEVLEGEIREGISLEFTADYSLTLRGNVLYPSGFLLDSASPTFSYASFHLLLSTGGTISWLNRLEALPEGLYEVQLPDFRNLPVRQESDLVSYSSYASQTIDDRGTPGQTDDHIRAVSLTGSRLVGQILEEHPLDLQFPDSPRLAAPSDLQDIPRNSFFIRWQLGEDDPQTAFIFIETMEQKRVWGIVVYEPSKINAFRLPPLPQEVEPFQSDQAFLFHFYASFPSATYQDRGTRIKIVQ